MIHVVVVPDGVEIVPGEGVGMDHPPERLRNEAAVRRVALFSGRHTQRTEHRTSILRLGPALLCLTRWNAPVHVSVPMGDTERDTLVEIVFGSALGRRVHRPDQMELALCVFFV